MFGPYHVIEARHQVTVVPLTRDGTLLLTREYRHGIGAATTGLPGGLVAPADGNDRSSAAARELEETGASGALERLAAIHPNPSNQTNTAFCFLATAVERTGRPVPGGDGEVQDVVEANLVRVLDELLEVVSTFHAVHAAALWSAAAPIAADQSGRFGLLTIRLRRLLVGESPRCSTAIRTAAALAAADASVAG